MKKILKKKIRTNQDDELNNLTAEEQLQFALDQMMKKTMINLKFLLKNLLKTFQKINFLDQHIFG